MHLRLRKCEKLPLTCRKLADLRLRNASCSFAEFAVAELSLNLRCPALVVFAAKVYSILSFELHHVEKRLNLQTEKDFILFCICV